MGVAAGVGKNVTCTEIVPISVIFDKTKIQDK